MDTEIGKKTAQNQALMTENISIKNMLIFLQISENAVAFVHDGAFGK